MSRGVGMLLRAWKRGIALVSLALSLLSGRAGLGAGHIHTDESVVGAAVRDDPGHLEELGRLELLDDVLELRLLDEAGQLVEALGARFDLLNRVLGHIQI